MAQALLEKKPETSNIDMKYFVSVPVSDYTKDGNTLLKSKRIDKLSLNILMVWLNRFIVKADDRLNTDWFGGKQENDEFCFWFKYEKDAERAKNFLKYVKDNAIPSHHKQY